MFSVLHAEKSGNFSTRGIDNIRRPGDEANPFCLNSHPYSMHNFNRKSPVEHSGGDFKA